MQAVEEYARNHGLSSKRKEELQQILKSTEQYVLLGWNSVEQPLNLMQPGEV